jgi:hypothetical protein
MPIEPSQLPRVLTPELMRRFAISRSTMRTELRRGRWQGLAAGTVLTRPDEPTRADWADVGVALAGRGAAVTGWDAVRTRGVGDRDPVNDLVVVLSRDVTGRVVGGVRIRQTDRPFTRRFQPLGTPLELAPIVALPRAVADTAVECRDLASVRALLGSAVQRGRCTVPELLAEYEAGPRNGSRFLRLALGDLRDGARSAAEARAARTLARSEVPPFELNVPILDQTGTLIRVVDILWRELRAALEIDSREFHYTEADWQATLRRHNQLTRWGLSATHYPPREVSRNRKVFVAEVHEWLQTRAHELQVPIPRGHGIRTPRDGEPTPFVLAKRP